MQKTGKQKTGGAALYFIFKENERDERDIALERASHCLRLKVHVCECAALMESQYVKCGLVSVQRGRML